MYSNTPKSDHERMEQGPQRINAENEEKQGVACGNQPQETSETPDVQRPAVNLVHELRPHGRRSPAWIHVVQDWRDGAISYGFQMEDALVLFTSDGTKVEHHKISTNEGHYHGEWMSSELITDAFLERLSGRNWRIDSYELFEAIKNYLRTYLVLPQVELYDVLSVWLMGTYVYRIFRYFPYVHLHGEKASGKTLAMELMAGLAFNSVVLSNYSESSIFRAVDAKRQTLLLDEVEFLTGKEGPRKEGVFQILNAGFHHKGRASRTDKENHGKQIYCDVYGPKVLAGINELSNVLADRAIPVHMRRKCKEDVVKRYSESRDSLALQAHLRDDLFLFGLSCAHAVAMMYQADEPVIPGLADFESRTADLMAPLLVVAAIIDRDAERGRTADAVGDVGAALVRFGEWWNAEKHEQDRQENPTVMLLVGLQKILNERGLNTGGSEITELKCKELLRLLRGQDALDFNIDTPGRLARRLGKLGIRTESRKVNGLSERKYMLDREAVRQIARRYGALLEDEADAAKGGDTATN
jgi:hypothetical protein